MKWPARMEAHEQACKHTFCIHVYTCLGTYVHMRIYYTYMCGRKHVFTYTCIHICKHHYFLCTHTSTYVCAALAGVVVIEVSLSMDLTGSTYARRVTMYTSTII